MIERLHNSSILQQALFFVYGREQSKSPAQPVVFAYKKIRGAADRRPLIFDYFLLVRFRSTRQMFKSTRPLIPLTVPLLEYCHIS